MMERVVHRVQHVHRGSIRTKLEKLFVRTVQLANISILQEMMLYQIVNPVHRESIRIMLEQIVVKIV
jgi:hypothetical protein